VSLYQPYFSTQGQTKEAVTDKGQLTLAGPAGKGRKAFGDDWCYLDADGNRRS
jgi:hypothetical protein